MGRKRTKRLDLPERVYFHHGAYYFVALDKTWIKLDRDYAKAMAAWAQLLQVGQGPAHTVGQLLDRYILEVIPGKAPRTQKDNLGEIRFLRAVLGDILLPQLSAPMVAEYRDARSAKTRANREIALLSHACSKACEWGLLTTNPCREVRRNRETPRDRYVTDEELAKFLEGCPPWLKAYVLIKALVGLRQQDMLVLKWSDVTADSISVLVQKTGKKMRITLTDELSSLISSLPRRGSFCFMTEDETTFTVSGFSSAWRRATAKFKLAGGQSFHEHDIRGKVATDINDPDKAQKLLGHKNRRMTEAYIKQRMTDVVQPLSRSKK